MTAVTSCYFVDREWYIYTANNGHLFVISPPVSFLDINAKKWKAFHQRSPIADPDPISKIGTGKNPSANHSDLEFRSEDRDIFARSWKDFLLNPRCNPCAWSIDSGSVRLNR